MLIKAAAQCNPLTDDKRGYCATVKAFPVHEGYDFDMSLSATFVVMPPSPKLLLLEDIEKATVARAAEAGCAKRNGEKFEAAQHGVPAFRTAPTLNPYENRTKPCDAFPKQ